MSDGTGRPDEYKDRWPTNPLLVAGDDERRLGSRQVAEQRANVSRSSHVATDSLAAVSQYGRNCVDAGYWSTSPPGRVASQTTGAPPQSLALRPRQQSHAPYPASPMAGGQRNVNWSPPTSPGYRALSQTSQEIQLAWPPSVPLHQPPRYFGPQSGSSHPHHPLNHLGQRPFVQRVRQNSNGSNVVDRYRADHMMLASTDEEAKSAGGLYTDFRRREKARKFFTFGKVFMTLWIEPAQDVKAEAGSQSTEDRGSEITEGITIGLFGEPVHSKVRRFVVIREGDRSCACLPILTYGGKGVGKLGTNKSEHAIIYTGRTEPAPLREERPVSVADGGLRLPIRVDPDTPEDKLDVKSRLNFAKVYTIEHYSKVRSVGKVNRASLPDLQQQFQLVWSVTVRNAAKKANRPAMAPGRSRNDSKHAEPSPHWERIAAYRTLCAHGWSEERACNVLFVGVGLAVPTADLGGARPADFDVRETKDWEEPATEGALADVTNSSDDN